MSPYITFLYLHFISLSGDLKSLLQLQPACPDLCCHIVKQHSQHGQTFAKYLKKHRAALPAQAPPLALLLTQDEIASTANAAVVKILDDIKEWVLDTDGDEDAISVLLPYTLERDLLSKFLNSLWLTT